MQKIAVLSKETIDQIAAGEVIERPASVVKELVENSIDAGANAVTVEIRDGGISFIRITDNGSGIAKEEVPTAFLRHATSKIQNVDDLQMLHTLGFRGEALSSIAAVSQVEVITKSAGALTGLRYVIEGGQEKESEEIGAPEGTTFLVRNLFFNTPARQKFLKSPVTEAGYVSELMERLALSRPEISFKFINQGKLRMHTAGNGKQKDIIYNIYGKEIAANLLSLDTGENEKALRICGFVGKPSVSRGNRNYENYYVNGRFVRSTILSKAIEEAYKPFLMNHRYPFTVLFLTIDTTQMDANVHPTKLEVRFSDQMGVYEQLYQAVKDTLAGKELIPEVSLMAQKASRGGNPETENLARHAQRPSEPFEQKRRIQETEQENTNHERTGFLRENTAVYAAGTQSPGSAGKDDQNPEAATVISGKKESVSGTPSGTGKSDLPLSSSPKESGQTDSSRYGDPDKRTFSGLKMVTGNIDPGMQKTSSVRNKDFNAASAGFREDERDIKNLIPANAGAAEAENLIPANAGFAEAENRIPANAGGADAENRIPANTVSADPEKRFSQKEGEKTPRGEQMSLVDDERLLTPESRKRHRLIGQVFDTFWIVEFQDKMYIIDQHAAHEKVLFERFMKEFREKRQTSQQLSPPMVLTLSMKEEEMLERFRPVFEEIGFEVEPFGGRAYAIRAVPGNLYGLEDKELFMELLDSLTEISVHTASEMIHDKVATMACKAAVKGNNRLSAAEADALITELLTLDNPYNCPHGRPTIISMSHYELDKKFRRVL